MGVDRHWEAQDELQACPARLAAANARISELESELARYKDQLPRHEERIRARAEADTVERIAAWLDVEGHPGRAVDVMAGKWKERP